MPKVPAVAKAEAPSRHSLEAEDVPARQPPLREGLKERAPPTLQEGLKDYAFTELGSRFAIPSKVRRRGP